MKKILIVFLLSSAHYFSSGQSNNYPLTGNAEINSGKLIIQTNTWRDALFTLSDIHYSPYQIYHFQLEADGLKIKENNTVNYQFKTGGDFIVNHGKVQIENNTYSESLLTFKSTYYSPNQLYQFQIEADGLKIKDNNTINYQFKTGGDFIVNHGNIGIGTTSPTYKLDVCGTIRAKEVKVDLEGGCDFVFKDNYKLMDLKKLEEFVKTNQHLPEIASEKEMIENGVNMKELQMKLLQKMEEMTLYMIEQNKKIETIEEKNKLLKQEIELLKTK